MKIAILEPHLGVFGGIRRMLELSNRLIRRGHEVIFYHSNGAPCTWMECLAQTKPDMEILEDSFDVVIHNDPTRRDFELARDANAKLKVFYCLGLYEKELMLSGFHPRKLLFWRGIARRTHWMKMGILGNDLVLSNSSWVQRWIQENLGVKSVLMIGGVNVEMFHPVDIARDPAHFRILYSGDLRPSKGTAYIEAALEIVRTELPHVVTNTYAGKGIPQMEMAAAYSWADLFVDAQIAGGWSNPVLEAMACRLPVVCTDNGGVEDFAFHERTALLVPMHDSKALAAAILRMANDPVLREELREHAYRHSQTFSWDESAVRLESVLKDALGQGAMVSDSQRRLQDAMSVR